MRSVFRAQSILRNFASSAAALSIVEDAGTVPGLSGIWKVGNIAQVGEWLKPADCKSAPPCEVRRFESSPVHQRLQ